MAEKRIYEVQYVEGFIAEVERLTAETKDQQAHINSLQAKVHLCTAYDKLEQQNTRLRELLAMWLEVNDWDGASGGLCQNTLAALTEVEK
ncbi:MAG: hypothetical protein GY938_31905 [Ketobacter sp.]|nr:hypothetical protein [Ketobacter sp.]